MLLILNRGDTPLHIVATMKPSNDMIPMFTNLLEILLDEGTHQDFVNHDGKTAMDLAETYEAYSILWKRRKLELKCISARGCKEIWSSLCRSSAQNTGELYIYVLVLCSKMKMQLEDIKILSNFLC